MIDAASWRRAEDLFHQALELPTETRAEWVKRSSADDEELCRLVLDMLVTDAEDTAQWIGAAIRGAASDLEAKHVVAESLQRLGPYKIVREIGAGGMSRVYLASRADDQYEKQVAVKLIDPEQAVSHERFFRERQILANLDHPYIARLMDGGTTVDGRPYLILDYVEGQPITEYCTTHKLSIADRCRLFLKVCEAVAYAHQNFVIHRDLKPANILVTEGGMPKLLDFGVAKLMDSADLSSNQTTRTSQMMMTPEYASPEQLQGTVVTTASDVYSLGTILYEMLCGERAHQFASNSAHEFVRVICDTQIPAPSRFVQDIPSDLDNIVQRALEKNPRRRYASVEQFAEDVDRYLNHMPVQARGGSFGYYFARFLQRNWIPVAAVVIATVSLTAGTIVSRRQAEAAELSRKLAVGERDRAEAERRRAEISRAEALKQRQAARRSEEEANRERLSADQRFGQLQSLIHKFLFDIDQAVQDLPGTSAARRAVAKTAIEYLDGMSKEPNSPVAIRRDLAAAYERVAELQGSPTKPSLGDVKGAQQSYLKALAIRQKLPLEAAQERREFMLLYEGLTLIENNLNNKAQAEQYIKEGLKLVTGKWADDPVLILGSAPLHYQYAEMLYSTSRTSEAIVEYHLVEKIYTDILSREPSTKRVRQSRALVRMKIGQMLTTKGDFAGGLPLLRESTSDFEEALRLDPGNVGIKRNLGIASRTLAAALGDRTNDKHKNFEEAFQVVQRSLALAKEMAASDPINVNSQYDVMRAVSAVARHYAQRDDWENTIRTFQEAAEMGKVLQKKDAMYQRVSDDMALFSAEIGNAQLRLKRFPDADRSFSFSIEIWEKLLKTGSASRFHRFNVALLTLKRGETAEALNDRKAARSFYEASLAAFTALTTQDPENKMFQMQLAEAKKALAKLDSN